MRGTIKNLIHKARLFTATFLLLAAQALAPISAFIPSANAVASGCEVDTAGANDEPGQKDLTKLCVNDTAVSTVDVTWNWDELDTSGANSLDACALFDTDNDGFINRSVCVTTKSDPAVLDAITIYTCGDDKIDRCTSPLGTLAGPYTTTCTIGQDNTDPFAAGAGFPADTVADCTILLSEAGGVTSELVDVCSYPSKQPNSDPSDCVIIVDNSAKIEIVKQIEPDTDSGLFNLRLDGVTKLANASDGDSTGEIQIVSDGNGENFVVSETPGTDTSLTNYTTSVVCKDGNGTGTTIASGSPSGAESRQLTVNVKSGTDVVCTFTNTRAEGGLTVIKDVINDNGGTKTFADFTFTVNGGTAQTFIETTSPDGSRTVSLPAGTSYTVAEPQANSGGYITAYSAGCSGTIVAGQTQTCTITNNDQPGTITINKVVVNDNGGTKAASDFEFTASGVNGGVETAFEADGSNTYTVNAGTYNVSETSIPSGYSMTSNTCTDVVVANGGTASCTITNDDIAPKITVVKIVTNDDGGTLSVSDFPLFVDDIQVTSGVEHTQFDAGLHVVSETNQPGYTAGQWSGDCDLNGNITLVVGGVYTCTITNDDQPAYIKVTKVVVNDNGGNAVVSDFTLKVDDINVVSGVNNTFDGNEEYTVSEVNIPNGYTQTSLVCNDVTGQSPVPVGSTFTAQLGHSYECVITNDDIAPGLTVIKKVVNDNGGSAVVGDFDLEINDNDLSFGSGVVNDNETTYTATPTIASNTDYTLSEVDFDGYTEGTWSCTDGTEGQGLTVTVNLNEAENVTCTITNNDIAPTLTLKKAVTNDDGGDNLASEWTLKAQEGANTPVINTTGTGHPVATTGAVSVMAATTYTLSESGPSGYTASEWVCTSDGGPAFSHPNGLTNEVRMNPGANVTCTITNNDIAPMLTLVKHVTNDSGGTAVASDWTLTANPIIGESITGNGDDGVVDEEAVANKEYFLEEQGPDGYQVSVDWSCDGGVFDAEDNSIILSEGSDVMCEITNDDIAPSLTIIKQTNSPSGELEFDFTGDLGEFDLMDEESEVADDLSVGSYEVTENAPTGWKLGYVDCDADFDEVIVNDKLVGIDVELGLADDVTCTFYNDKLGEVSGYKFEDVDANGEWDEGEPALEGWTINLIRICEEPEITLDLLIDINDIAIPEEECEEAVVDTQVTDENGAYKFENIDFGTYKVCEVLQDGWIQTYPEWNDGCHQGSIFESGQVEEDINFGNFKLAESTGFKFEDANGNRMWDEGEKALSGWTINLWQCVANEEVASLRQVEVPCEDEIVATDVTDENGAYSFEGLEPGDYTVCEVQQSGWTRTLPADSDCYEFEVEESGQVVTNNFGNKRITRVLGELVNTGTPMWAGLAVGLSILGLAGAATFLTRRQITTSNK